MVGFVGAGRMGRPMVERLLGAGVPTSLYARRPDRSSELEARGAVLAGSLSELAAGAEVVVVCVFTDEQVAAVCLGPDGLVASMRPDATLVVHTTGSPVTSGGWTRRPGRGLPQPRRAGEWISWRHRGGLVDAAGGRGRRRPGALPLRAVHLW